GLGGAEPVVERAGESLRRADLEVGDGGGVVHGADLQASDPAGGRRGRSAGGEADTERGGRQREVVVDGAPAGLGVGGGEGQLVGDQAGGDRTQEVGGAEGVGAGRAVEGDLGERETAQAPGGDREAVAGAGGVPGRAGGAVVGPDVPAEPVVGQVEGDGFWVLGGQGGAGQRVYQEAFVRVGEGAGGGSGGLDGGGQVVGWDGRGDGEVVAGAAEQVTLVGGEGD